jgi:hypothetical protein
MTNYSEQWATVHFADCVGTYPLYTQRHDKETAERWANQAKVHGRCGKKHVRVVRRFVTEWEEQNGI